MSPKFAFSILSKTKYQSNYNVQFLTVKLKLIFLFFIPNYVAMTWGHDFTLYKTYSRFYDYDRIFLIEQLPCGIAFQISYVVTVNS